MFPLHLTLYSFETRVHAAQSFHCIYPKPLTLIYSLSKVIERLLTSWQQRCLDLKGYSRDCRESKRHTRFSRWLQSTSATKQMRGYNRIRQQQYKKQGKSRRLNFSSIFHSFFGNTIYGYRLHSNLTWEVYDIVRGDFILREALLKLLLLYVYDDITVWILN